MKRNWYKILTILIILIILGNKEVYGATITISDLISSDIISKNVYIATFEETGRNQEKIIEDLKEQLGYEGEEEEEIPTQLKLKTFITVVNHKFGAYTIKFGTRDSELEVPENYLEDVFGFDETQFGKGLDELVFSDFWEDPDRLEITWNINMIVSVEDEFEDDSYELRLRLDKVFTWDELDDIDKEGIDDEPANLEANETVDITGGIEDSYNNFTEVINNITTNISNLTSNPIGYVLSIILDFITWIADVFQIIIDMVQTTVLNTYSDWTITYTYDELADDRNMYTNVEFWGTKETTTETTDETIEETTSETTNETTDDATTDTITTITGSKQDWQKEVIIDGTEEGFSYETEIPVIPVDTYTMSIGNIDFLDVNIFSSDDSVHTSAWLTIKNFGTTVIHVTMYLSAAFLLATLIWHGIYIVKGSVTPKGEVEHKEGLVRFGTSLLMLVGTVVVMAICIYGVDMLSEILLGDEVVDSYELPIRVHVQSARYSFSTNLTGYVRYMAQISSLDFNLLGKRASFVFTYLILVIVNGATLVLMGARMLIMLVLAMIGPIIAALHSLDAEGNGTLNYRNWAKLYASFTIIQLILVIASKIILDYTLF